MEKKLKQEADKFVIMRESRQQKVHVVWLSLLCMDSQQMGTPKAGRKYFLLLLIIHEVIDRFNR